MPSIEFFVLAFFFVLIFAIVFAIAWVKAVCVTTDLYEKLEEAMRHSTIDYLTGVLNRRGIFKEVWQAMNLVRRGEYSTVAFIDLDGLKKVNDTEGHAAGDELLKNFTSFLQGHLRTADRFGRMGGDEFLIVFYQLDKAGAQRVMEKLQKSSNNFSFGLCEIESSDNEKVVEDIVRHADQEMYKNKTTRKGT